MIPDMMSCRRRTLGCAVACGRPARSGERGADGADVYGAVCGIGDAAGVDLGRDYCGMREVREDGKFQ